MTGETIIPDYHPLLDIPVSLDPYFIEYQNL